MVNKNIIGCMLTINMDESMSTNICFLGSTKYTVQVASINGNIGITFSISCITAAVDITINSNLCLHQCCRQTK